MMIKRIFSLLLLLIPLNVSAASLAFQKSNLTLEEGSTGSITLTITDIGDVAVNASNGNLSISNPSCITVTKYDGLNGTTATSSKFMGSYLGGLTSKTEIVKISFKANDSVCSTNISAYGAKITFMDGTSVKDVGCSATINVVAPKSSNNNLSSLSISNANINFSSNVTSYNVSVGANVDSVTISGNVEDSKASLKGTGDKKLNFGKNTFSIIVTAENGSTKTYTVNVNREDNRSDDATLKSLTIENAKLNPGFSSNVTKYNVSVEYAISKLKIVAIANDDKAKVDINNVELKAEETTAINIVVHSERGNTKTYTINATRGKDPNKVLSTNNNLEYIKPSYGDLSPIFNPEQLNYVLYVPYEIDNVSFSLAVEDKKYATIKEDLPKNFVENSYNIYKYTVTAEDSSTKTYTINVFRGKNVNQEDYKVNLNIKSIDILKGKIDKNFDSNITYYYYKGDFEFNYELEDKNAISKIYNEKDKKYVVVEDNVGNIKVYSFIKQKANIYLYILIIVCFIVVCYFGYKFYKSKKSTLNKEIKSKKASKNDNKNKS